MARRTVVFDWEARDELHRAHDWYRARNQEAAEKFLSALDDAVELVVEAPERWMELEPGIRRVLLRGFPYALVYAVQTEHVVVLAVMHGRRRPGYWRSRKGEP